LRIIATRSLSTELPGILNLVEDAKVRIRNGITAYVALQKVRADAGDTEARATLDKTWRDLGYGLLLKLGRPDIENATEDDIAKAASLTIPDVPVLFWSFRLMVALGFYFIGFFAVAFWVASRHRLGEKRWMLHVALWSLPLPWVAVEVGWLVAEFGRQPWSIEGVLPTFYAASGLTIADLSISLAIFLIIYSSLAVVEIYLMLHVIRKGPSGPEETQPVGAGMLPLAAAAEPQIK